MTIKRWIVLIAVSALGFLLPFRSGGALVDVEAARLKQGSLHAFTAGGDAAIGFSAGGKDSIYVGVVAGRRAVSFTGVDGLASSFPVPFRLTGTNAFTVAVWVFNPVIGGEEPLVQWALRGQDSRAACLNYGSAPASGAVVHWGAADMGFEGAVPPANAWHHLAVTYTGGERGTEALYVDGKVVATEVKSLNLLPGFSIHIGHTQEAQGFSGSMASVQMYGETLSAAEIKDLAASKPIAAKPLVDLGAGVLPEGPLWQWANTGVAGGVFRRASMPRVETVAGRPAIVFDGGQNLVSDGILPALGTNSPFTVEAWLFNPSLGNAETYAALVAPDTWPVLFNFSKSLFDSAFAAQSRSVAFHSTPESNLWHHLAVTYSGGPKGILETIVDGERDTSLGIGVCISEKAKLVVGAGGRRGFSGALASLRVHDRALTLCEVRRSAGLESAFNPEPRSGSSVETLSVTLGWERGVEAAVGYAVYFCKDKDPVEKRSAQARVGQVPGNQPHLGPLVVHIGETYYWCVDQLNAGGHNAWPGVVWTFRVDDGQATGAQPGNHTANTLADMKELTWIPGRFATRQHVFFGADEQTVLTSTNPASGDLAGKATRCPLPAALIPGVRYYWRVDSDNGDEPPTRGPVWAFRTQDAPVSNDVTFFVVSDTHYAPDPASYAGVRATIASMNWIPGTAYPDDLGGSVRTPRGVLHTGDMVDSGEAPWATAVWSVFTNDFGVNGEGRVCYPVFEIVGNHDGGDGFPPQEGVRTRNRLRHGLTGLSTNGLHYSWNWDQLHMVGVNKFVGSTRDPSRPFNQVWNDPTGSLEFLADDLKMNAGGRPTIIFQHYGFDGFSAGWGWWSTKDRTAAWTATRDYNVVAFLHGHTHAASFVKWKGEDFHLDGQRIPEEGVDIIGCASGQRGPEMPGEFMVFHVTDKEMTVAHRFADHWGESRRIPIPSAPRWPGTRTGKLKDERRADR